MTKRSNALADRLDQGATSLAAFASGLTDEEWQLEVPHDGRRIGVTVHHVATMYPLEIELTQTIVAGKPIVGVTWPVVDEINANHAREFASVTKQEALDLLRKNSKAASDAIRALSDDDLDRATNVSLYGDAPLTAQFFLEDHPVRHSFHHLARLRAALQLAVAEF